MSMAKVVLKSGRSHKGLHSDKVLGNELGVDSTDERNGDTGELTDLSKTAYVLQALLSWREKIVLWQPAEDVI